VEFSGPVLHPLPDFAFHCYPCGAEEALGDSFLCGECGAPLSLRFTGAVDPALLSRSARSLWDFRAFLPIPRAAEVISLGEGATPLVMAPALAARHRLGAVSLKNEMANPTGSFKDRQVSVGLTWARSQGYDTVAVVSSGNVASAAAAYCARSGMKAVLFMHGQASPAKIAQAQAYGAVVISVDDPSPNAVFQLCIEACKTFGWYHLSTAGMYEPWNVEGAKTIAYELYQQYGGNLPDWIVAPVGGGGLLGGIWRGLLDMKALGLLSNLPRLAGVQATGCAPLQEAMDNDWNFEEHLAHPWQDPKTIAGAIADDILFDGHTVLPALRETWGAAIAVTDDAMIEAQGLLARTEGLLCEIATASAIAALNQLPLVDSNTTVCCIVSGSGLKDLGRLAESAAAVPKIPATLEALQRVLDRQG
jgi:threonine synthase